MSKLNQVIAVEKSVKNASNRTITDLYHTLQRPPLMSGLARTYQPKDDEGEQLPPESTRVQVTCTDIIGQASEALIRLFDVTATKDWGNCHAKANVTVDGAVLLRDAPVTYLLFLEKQLTDLRTFIDRIPILDPAENWTFDETKNVWRTDPVQTLRTKKVPRNHVKAEATDRHPAQVDVYYEDITIGTWTRTIYSGALPISHINTLRDRLDKLSRAVKYAREEANSTEVEDRRVGEGLMAYLFA